MRREEDNNEDRGGEEGLRRGEVGEEDEEE